MKFLFLHLLILLHIMWAQKTTSYENLFMFLESKKIVVGRDISHDDLYQLLQDNSISTKNGINFDFLYARILEKNKLIDPSISKEKKLEERYQLNQVKASDKEVLTYLKDQNNIFDKAKEKRNEVNKNNENKSWFSERFDHILEKLKL